MDAKQVGLGSLLLAASGATLILADVPGGRLSLALAVVAVLGFVVLSIRERATDTRRYA